MRALLSHLAGGETEALHREGQGRLEAEDIRKQGGTWSVGFVDPGGARQAPEVASRTWGVGLELGRSVSGPVAGRGSVLVPDLSLPASEVTAGQTGKTEHPVNSSPRFREGLSPRL